jgi:hypothetical protein
MAHASHVANESCVWLHIFTPDSSLGLIALGNYILAPVLHTLANGQNWQNSIGRYNRGVAGQILPPDTLLDLVALSTISWQHFLHSRANWQTSQNLVNANNSEQQLTTVVCVADLHARKSAGPCSTE